MALSGVVDFADDIDVKTVSHWLEHFALSTSSCEQRALGVADC